jgi:signal transduction histidine kinase
MRGPLRSMRGYAQILTSEYLADLKPEPRRFLERIDASAQRMDQLIQDVLNFSKVSRDELTLEPVNLDALAREVIEMYPNLSAGNSHIRIEGQLPVVLGNGAALTQCLSNLLGNALKFARPNVAPEICVRAELTEGRARIYIEDNGVGIPEPLHERIFELFQRGSQSTEGTGIGLAIVKKSVERMGGRVGLTSVPGQGSSFWFDLDVVSGSEAA